MKVDPDRESCSHHVYVARKSATVKEQLSLLYEADTKRSNVFITLRKMTQKFEKTGKLSSLPSVQSSSIGSKAILRSLKPAIILRMVI